ncbi:MAG: hypothetical protein WDO69_17470 [Pseudomonadota bacterium]
MKLSPSRALDLFAVLLVVVAVLAIGAKNYERNADVKLLNVSYDPTRELYKTLNPRFIEKYQHGMRDSQKDGLTVLLAGIRPDLSSAFTRLSFADWFPEDRVFVEEDEVDSATLKAIRKAYALLGSDNPCVHCSTRVWAPSELRAAYYLV